MHVGNFSNIKGDKLQKAVESIEELIVSTNPSFINAKKIVIDRKKIIKGRIRHEIDLYVKVDLADRYEAIFIFECKNWDKKVGKNEIILFSKKIQVTDAQKGFFIAKGFTKYAKGQALEDKKIELVIANDNTFDLFLSDLTFSFNTWKPKDITIVMLFFDGKEYIKINGDHAELNLDGEKKEFKEYVKSLVKKAINIRLKERERRILPEGTHKDRIEKEYDYNDMNLTLNNKRIYKILLRIDLKIVVTIIRPKIISGIEVRNRGSYYEFESCKTNNGFEYNLSVTVKDHIYKMKGSIKKKKTKPGNYP